MVHDALPWRARLLRAALVPLLGLAVAARGDPADPRPAGDAAPGWGVKPVVWSAYESVVAGDSSPLALRPGGGISISAGALLLLPFPGYEVQVTAGWKEDGFRTISSSHRYRCTTLEVLGARRMAPVRIAAGLAASLSPSLTGSGPEAVSFDMRDALGAVVQADVAMSGGPAGPRSFIGLRFVWQSFQPKGNSGSIGGSTLGLLAGLVL